MTTCGIGIQVFMLWPNAGPNYPYFGSNFWQPWSKKSRMEFFDKSKDKQFEAHFDLEIHGGWSEQNLKNLLE